jgi:hypothetical protein
MIRETEVDGVPTLLAPTHGPMHAGLIFRVGRADETLATAGITHLVEHLALYRHGLPDYHFNGATESVFTSFHMQGGEGDVVAFLAGVCDSLVDMPMDRLAVEKEILRTEAAGRRSGVNRQLPLWRYGAVGYGLVSYPEWGLTGIGPEHVHHWVRSWFTRENAVLWIAGRGIPTGLRLRLPSGVRRGVPPVSSALPVTPAYFSDGEGVVMDAVVRRSTAASVFAGVFERELFRSLRQEGGYSYTATTDYDSRGDGYATITAFADALPEKQDAVLGGFVDALARMRIGRIEPGDLASVRAKRGEVFNHPEVHAARLGGAATNVLTGEPVPSLEQLRDELAAVTLTDLYAVAQEMSASTLIQAPDGHRVDWAGYTAAPSYSEHRVDGERFLSRESAKVGLVVGTEGVSLVDEAHALTVLFTACAGMLAWPDGARQLIGSDGITIRVEPTLWQLDPRALHYIDSRVPAALVAQMPPRSPDAVPQPKQRSAPAPALPTPAAPRKRGTLEIVGIVVLSVMTVFCGLTGVIGTLAIADTPESGGGEWGVIGAGWFITAIIVFALVIVVRRGKR